jgi:hypothetical protein
VFPTGVGLSSSDEGIFAIKNTIKLATVVGVM